MDSQQNPPMSFNELVAVMQEAIDAFMEDEKRPLEEWEYDLLDDIYSECRSNVR